MEGRPGGIQSTLESPYWVTLLLPARRQDLGSSVRGPSAVKQEFISHSKSPLRTVKQRRTQIRSNGRAQAGLPELTGKPEKRGPWRQGQGSARDQLPLPTALLVSSLVGSGRVEEVRAFWGRSWGGERGRAMHAPRGGVCWVLRAEGFSLSLSLSLSCRRESLGRSPGTVSVEQGSVL